MKHHIQPKALQTLSDDHYLISQISQLNPNLPKPKLLKSCIRCRKHKTKCDAHDRNPLPCSSCSRKGCPCKIDYVLPPQRSDNLKNLISQVDFIKDQYDTLSSYYLNISEKLGVKLESFEEWKLKNGCSHSAFSGNTGNGVHVAGNDLNTISETDDNNQSENEESSVINLLKLSDGSFISMDLNLDLNQITINNNVIDIAAFDKLLSNLLAKLHHLNSVFLKNSYNDQNDNETDEHDPTSPISLPSPKQGVHTLNHDNVPNSWFDLRFDIKSLFKSNKFLLIMLISFYYPHFQLNFQLFLKDYLVSYYSIIETLNKSSDTSTYSSNLLMHTLMNNKTNYDSNSSVIIFNKFQLRCLIDSEIFNSEYFLKKLIELLFLNVIMNGIDANLEILNQFIKFVQENINNNRKKLNFDKVEHLKLIERFINLLNLFQSLDINSSPDQNSNISSSKSKSSKSSISSSSGPAATTNEVISLNFNGSFQINERNLSRFEDLILKDFEFFQKSNVNDDTSINASATGLNIDSNNDHYDKMMIDGHSDDENRTLSLQNLSLFKPMSTSPSLKKSTSTINLLEQSSTEVSRNKTVPHSLVFNNKDLKVKFNKFIENWSQFYANFESKFIVNNLKNELKLFIDDFLLDLKVLNISLLIYKGYKDFQPLLYQIKESYLINESLSNFINVFNNHVSGFSSEETNIVNDEFSCEKMKLLFLRLTSLIANKNSDNYYKDDDSTINDDIQNILETVDWKKESTDDVLRKIGVI